jgi:hypothetical protein
MLHWEVGIVIDLNFIRLSFYTPFFSNRIMRKRFMHINIVDCFVEKSQCQLYHVLRFVVY